MATTITGPASKDTVSGGKKFPIKESEGAVASGKFNMGNTSTEAHSKIMALRYKPEGQHAVTERDFKGKKLA